MNRRVLGFALAVASVSLAAPAVQAHDDTTNHTITGDGAAGFQQLVDTGAGYPRIVREDIAPAGATRATGRSSLLYAGQLTDFQLSDEESPARVEFLDVNHPQNPASAAQRPQEALLPFMVNEAIKALNLDMDISPHGTGAGLELTLVTGDQADSQQKNEVEWVVKLLEGGHLKPNSGVEDNLPICGANGEADKYTGVQDYDDYLETGSFYDPDQPASNFAAWPVYTGLMDRAQKSFNAVGTDAPTYVTNGNHDSLVQGNAWATLAYETVATGCSKPFAPVLLQNLAPGFPGTSPENVGDVPRDPNRQYVNKAQTRALHDTGAQADAHGYDYVEAAELAASNGAASYYAFSPKAGIQIVSIDTVSEGGVIAESSNGNIDAPQFQWLSNKLDAIEAANPNDLIIVMGHHPIRSLTSRAPDEVAAQCTGLNDGHGHDPNPGCDADPRISDPVKGGADLQALLLAHDNVVAYVTGHTHEHNIDPFARADGSGGFWGIETSAIVDWPVQGRVIEIVDNGDDTLSIFGTVFDHDGPVTGPAPPISNSNPLNTAELASIGRTLAYNDPQAGPATGVGALADRNVELILPDPR